MLLKPFNQPEYYVPLSPILLITFTILSIATQSTWTWTTVNCFAVFKAGHIRVAGVNGTILDFNVAARTSKTNVAVTGVVIDKVNASTYV